MNMGQAQKNMLQLLYVIVHEIIVSNSVSEYTAPTRGHDF